MMLQQEIRKVTVGLLATWTYLCSAKHYEIDMPTFCGLSITQVVIECNHMHCIYQATYNNAMDSILFMSSLNPTGLVKHALTRDNRGCCDAWSIPR
jgi:hypothetical protein